MVLVLVKQDPSRAQTHPCIRLRPHVARAGRVFSVPGRSKWISLCRGARHCARVGALSLLLLALLLHILIVLVLVLLLLLLSPGRPNLMQGLTAKHGRRG